MKLAALLFASLLFFKCETKKSVADMKVDIAKQEREHPEQYIKIENTGMHPRQVLKKGQGLFKKDTWESDGFDVSGVITNKATIAKFKDVKISINYLSKTGTVISRQNEIIYEIFDVNVRHHFIYHVYAPEEIASFTVTFVSATPI